MTHGLPPFQYTRLRDFTYHILTDPVHIKNHLTKWILPEWELDHNQAPDEPWTVEWTRVFPQMDFALEILPIQEIHPHPDLWSLQDFQASLKERAEER